MAYNVKEAVKYNSTLMRRSLCSERFTMREWKIVTA